MKRTDELTRGVAPAPLADARCSKEHVHPARILVHSVPDSSRTEPARTLRHGSLGVHRECPTAARPPHRPTLRRRAAEKGRDHHSGFGERKVGVDAACGHPMTRERDYRALQKYLEERYADRVVLTFTEIEDLIGCLLPEGARFEQAWWSANQTP